MELVLLALLLVFVAAWIGGAAAHRLGYPVVLGELLAGIILGPALLGLLGDGSWLAIRLGIDGGFAPLEIIGHVGVLLMMLYIGMEIDPKELGKASWTGFLAAIGGFITPFALGIGVMLLFGEGVIPGMFVAIALGVTSLAVNSRIVVDLRILDTRIAHVMLAGALIADTLCLLVFSGLLPFAQAESLGVGGAGLLIGRALAFFVGVSILGIWILPRVMRLLRRLGITSLSVYFTLLVVIAFLFGQLAEMAGLHAIIGTFFAGLFLREGMLDPRATRELNQFIRIVSVSFLAPIFFVLTGFHVSFEVFQTDLWLLLAVMLVAFVGKIAGTMLFYLPTGHGWREGLVLGAGMNGRGAVEIILAQVGFSLGLISREVFSILVFMAIATTATVPLFLKWGTDWLKRRGELVRSAEKRSGYLIIGATRTARALARLLKKHHPVTLIDSNPARAAEAREEGLDTLVGNALENEILVQAKAAEAGHAIAMTSNVEINVLAARHLRDLFLVPRLDVLVLGPNRTADQETLEHLEAGMLFGRPVALNDWDHWFAREMVTFERIPMPQGDVAASLEALAAGNPVLPLAVERDKDGVTSIEPYRGEVSLQAGDMLWLARARVAVQPARDDFDDYLQECKVLDLREELTREEFLRRAATELGAEIDESPDDLYEALLERESQGSTELSPGLAVPHAILGGHERFALLVARVRPGVALREDSEPVRTLFVLAASRDMRNFHLKSLSAIAQIWQSSDFESRWDAAASADDLRRMLLTAQRQRTAYVTARKATDKVK